MSVDAIYQDLTDQMYRGLEFFMAEARSEITSPQPVVRNPRLGDLQDMLHAYRKALVNGECRNYVLLEALELLIDTVHKCITPKYDPDAKWKVHGIERRIAGLKVASDRGFSASF